MTSNSRGESWVLTLEQPSPNIPSQRAVGKMTTRHALESATQHRDFRNGAVIQQVAAHFVHEFCLAAEIAGNSTVAGA